MAELANLVQRLEVAVSRLECVSGSGGSAGGSSAGGAVSAYVDAYDEILNGPVAKYLSLSKQIGGHVQEHADMMNKAFSALREILIIASTSQKPSDADLMRLLQPVSKQIQCVQNFRELNRTSPLFNHLSSVSESVTALGWVSVTPKPGPFVKEMQDAAMFYTNRVLKDYKEKDKTHVEWVKAYLTIWTETQSYIKQHHTTGVAWSKSGPVASASAAPAGGCAPPPPPPGPPPPPMDTNASSGGGGDAGTDSRNALFKSINRGADITIGLKHVSDEMKTHKNPELRGKGAPVRTGPKPFASPPTRPPASGTQSQTKPPKLELDGKKWKVENQDGKDGLVISDTEIKQVVYVFNCNKSTLEVKGKINSITLDNCKKMGLVFDDVVCTVDVINCKNVQLQVRGKLPTISINKTDGCQVYLSKDSLGCEIVSAKSSEMNISVPTNQEGDYTEHAVPEQFKTVWDPASKKLVTTDTEATG